MIGRLIKTVVLLGVAALFGYAYGYIQGRDSVRVVQKDDDLPEESADAIPNDRGEDVEEVEEE